MDDLLELKTRRKIYNLIIKNPGLHLSKIAYLCNMRVSLVEYHLTYMEKSGVISSAKYKGYKRYYIKGKIGREDKKFLSILRQEIPLRVTLFLLKEENAQHKDILKNVNISASTLSYHLKKLIDIGIIEVQKKDSYHNYSIRNKKYIFNILMDYRPFDLFDNFENIWSDLKI
jgi:predicted transcriptional regulator